MKYKLVKETKPRLSTFGKYKAKAVHNEEVGEKQIMEEAARRLGVDDSVIHVWIKDSVHIVTVLAVFSLSERFEDFSELWPVLTPMKIGLHKTEVEQKPEFHTLV
jgi:hypothetical protein